MGPGFSLGTGLDLSLDPPEAAAAVAPRLLSTRLTVVPGLLRAAFSDSVWSHLGRISLSAWDLTTSSRKGISAFYPASPALSYATAITCTGLTIGNQYRLDYWLNCDPDVAGYVEAWYQTTLVWTHPSGIDPPIDELRVFGV